MKKIRSKYLLLLLIIFALIFYINTGLTAAERNEITADEITINTEDGEQEIVAQGNARVVYDKMAFSGDTIHYNTDSEDISLEGDITLVDEDHTIKGDTLDGNIGRGIFTIDGGEKEVEITGPQLYAAAGVINYRRNEGLLVLEQNPVFTYKELEAAADKITYNLEKRTALLSGNVEGVQGDGREFSAERIDVNMETEEIKMSGRANFIIKEKESDAAAEDKSTGEDKE